MSTFDTVLYHRWCTDGTTAAWLLWRHNKQAEYVGIQYGEELVSESLLKDKRVAIVDMSYPRETILKITSMCKSLVILDHHASAQRDLEDMEAPNLYIKFDMSKCGAELVYDWLPEEQRICCTEGLKYHWILVITRDRDLWVWEYPWTKGVQSYLYSQRMIGTIEAVNNLYESGKSYEDFLPLAENHQRIMDLRHHDIAKMAKIILMHTDEKDYRVSVVTCRAQDRSDVGNLLCQNRDIDFAVMIRSGNEMYYLSLRSHADSEIDLSSLKGDTWASGGHKHASGFEMKSLDTLFSDLA